MWTEQSLLRPKSLQLLDHKLGNNSNKDFLPTTEFAEERQQRTQILIDETKQNIMQSYLKYKEYYDRKAKAAPLNENDFCFILQPEADNQKHRSGITVGLILTKLEGSYPKTIILSGVCIQTKRRYYTESDWKSLSQINL